MSHRRDAIRGSHARRAARLHEQVDNGAGELLDSKDLFVRGRSCEKTSGTLSDARKGKTSDRLYCRVGV